MTYNETKELERRILETPFGSVQEAINKGDWDSPKFNAMKFYIGIGACMYAERAYWTKSGLYIPSRYKVQAGAIGSPQYVKTWFPMLLQEMEQELMQLN